MKEMVSKERQSRGEDHAKAKVTEAQVREIRRKFKTGRATLVQLGEEYGLRPDYLSKIVNGHYWKHVD